MRVVPQAGGVPEVRVTVYRSGLPAEDLTLRYPLDPDHDVLLRSLHGCERGVLECRMHDDDPLLWDRRDPDGRVRGAWLLLRRNPFALPGAFPLLLCHWPNSFVAGTHPVPGRMTLEHRRRQEYIARRGTAAGYEVAVEKSLGRGTRSDVVVKGEAILAAEVQQTGIELREVLRRSGAAVKAGATPTWFADEKDPPWAFRVPHVETNKRLGMAPGTWTVATGPRTLESERCEPGARVDCIRGQNWCGRSHLLWVPMSGVTVDALVEMVPAGELVRVDTRTRQGTILASPRDEEAWLEEHPPDDRGGSRFPPSGVLATAGSGIPTIRRGSYVRDSIGRNEAVRRGMRRPISSEIALLLMMRRRFSVACWRLVSAIVVHGCILLRGGSWWTGLWSMIPVSLRRPRPGL